MTKPSAWIGLVGQTMPHEIYEAWAKAHPDDAKHFRPIYDQSALDAAVADERDRCAKLCEEIGDQYQTLESRKYPELRSDAETGAKACESAIRRQ